MELIKKHKTIYIIWKMIKNQQQNSLQKFTSLRVLQCKEQTDSLLYLKNKIKSFESRLEGRFFFLNLIYTNAISWHVACAMEHEIGYNDILFIKCYINILTIICFIP